MQFDFGAVLAFAVAALVLGSVFTLIRRWFGRGEVSGEAPGVAREPLGSPAEAPAASAEWLWIALRTVAVLIGLALLLPAALVLRRHVFDGRGAEAWMALAAFIVPLLVGVGARRVPPG